MGAFQGLELRQKLDRAREQPKHIALGHGRKPCEPDPRQGLVRHPPFRQGRDVCPEHRRFLVGHETFCELPNLKQQRHETGTAARK